MAGSVNLSYDIVATTAQAARALEQLSRTVTQLGDRLDRVDGRRVSARVDADTGPADGALDRLSARLRLLGTGKTKIQIDVDKSLSDKINQFAMLGRSLSSLAAPAALISSLPAIMGIANALVDLSGVAGVAVGGIAAIGAVAATAKIGMQGFGGAMKAMASGDAKKLNEELAKLAPNARNTVLAFQGLQPAFKAMQLDVQQRLFAGMGAEVRTLGATYMPILRHGMDGVAGGLNQLVINTANYLKSAQATGSVRTIFDSTSGAMHNMSRVGADIVSMFLNVASVGSSFLPGLATGWQAAADKAALFIQHAKETGNLQQWMQKGLDTLKQLGAVIGNVFSTLWGVMNAASAAGGGFLGNLVLITQSISDMVNSVQGFNILVTVFSTISTVVASLMQVVQALLPALAPVVSVIGQMAVVIAQGLVPVAQALAPLLGMIATTVGQVLMPVLTALMPAFTQIAQALTAALMPVLPQVVNALQLIVGAAIPLIASFQTLTPIFGVLAQVAADVIVAWAPFVALMANTFQQVLAALVPVIGQVAQILGQALVMAMNAVYPLLPPIIDAIMGMVTAALPLVPILVQVGTTILGALLPVLPVLSNALLTIIAALMPIIPIIVQLVQQLLPPLGLAFDSIVQALLPLLPPILDLITALLPPLIQLVQTLSPVIVQLAGVFGDILAHIISTIVVPVLQLLIWVITTILVPTVQFLATIIGEAFTLIGNIITFAWNSVIKPIWDAIVAFINFIFKPNFDFLFAVVQSVFGSIGSFITAAWVNVIKPIWDAMVQFITVTIPDGFRQGVAFLAQVWDGIKKALHDPVDAVINVVYNQGIVKAWNMVAGFLGLGGLSEYHLPAFASGGPIRGGIPGRDSVPLVGMDGEYIFSKAAVQALGGVPRVDALHRALSGGTSIGLDPTYKMFGGDQSNPGLAYGVGMAAGGAVDQALAYARAQNGKPYQWGGVGNPSFDCSGFMSAIQSVLMGQPVHRLYSTASFAGGRGAAGLVPGTGSQFVVGVRQGNPGHMAGNLAGTAVESNGSGVTVGRGTSPMSFPAQFFLPQVGGVFTDAGGGGGGIDPLAWLMSQIGFLLDIPKKLIGGNPAAEMMVSLGGKMVSTTWDWLLNKAKDFVGTIIGAIGGPAGVIQGAMGARNAVMAAASAYGWNKGAEGSALDYIVSHESGYNPTAQNPTSTAFGMFQFLDSTWATVGGSKTSDPGLQSIYGMRYIKQKYGDPIAAQAFWNAHHWYGNGGMVHGPTFGMLGESGPEVILPLTRPARTAELMSQAGLAGEAGGLTVYLQATPNASAERLIGAAMHQARLRRLAGRYVGRR